MANYLMKYKGTYRILAELDRRTNDVPRDTNGNVDDDFIDLYIACQNGNRIIVWGKEPNGRVLLQAYIPSVGRGKNIKKAMDEKGIFYSHYFETDAEVEFRFRAKDIEEVATLLKAKTSGANISPFSIKNLPKANVEIPTEEIERYKAVIAQVEKGDLLIIHRLTTDFLSTILTKKYKKLDKSFSYQSDMRKLMMGRMAKEYIWTKGMFEEYLDYLNKKIEKFYKDKASKIN